MNKRMLFIASCVSLIATSMSFVIRADIMGDFEREFVKPMVATEQGITVDELDAQLKKEAAKKEAAANQEKTGDTAEAKVETEAESKEKGASDLIKTPLGLIGTIWGVSFGLLILFGGPLVDFLGMKRLLCLAAVCHIGGVFLTIFAWHFWIVVIGVIIVGAGNGLVEAVCNPLIATLYPDEKTYKLTMFHAWFPGGLVIGGVLAFLMTKMGLGWQLKMSLILVPSIIYTIMILGLKFPLTERVAAGISFGDMLKESVRRPLFILLFLMMWLTATSELVPQSWIPNIYMDVFGSGAGVLFLVWGSGIMFILRQFCSKPFHKMSPPLLLTLSAPFAVIGLFMFKYADTSLSFLLAVTLLNFGVAFWWPTMLGITSERCPKTGALGLAIIGGAGCFAVSAFGPLMGYLSDTFSPSESLQLWAVIPLIVFIVFLLVYLKDKASGGYQKETLAVAGGGEADVEVEEDTE